MLLLLLLTSGEPAIPQQKPELPPADTVVTRTGVRTEPILMFNPPMPLTVPNLEAIEFLPPQPMFFLPEPPPYPFLLLDQSGAKPDLLAPLRLQRAEEERMRTLYTVLGTVQVAGVAYLAYRHVKKYGVLK